MYQETPRIAPNLTDRDLSGYLGAGVQAKGGLVVRFFYARVRFGGTSGPLVGKFETRLFVALQPRGDRLTEAVEQITPERAQAEYPMEYHAFRTNEDTPTNGTPLNDLPGMTQAMISQLVLSGIRSIEDLINVPPDMANQIGLDAVTARNIALTWFKRKDEAGDTIKMADQLARSDAALQDAMNQLAAMRESNAVQERTLAALQAMGAAPMHQGQTPGASIMVSDPAYETSGMADVFGVPAMVTGAQDMRDPLED